MKAMSPSEKAAVSVSEKKPAKIKSPEKMRMSFAAKLREIYWCEKSLADHLPQLSKMATSYELTSTILAHLAVTENQIIRLIHVFDAIGERAVGNNCSFIDNILSEQDFTNFDAGFNRDQEIILSAQKIMKFEMKSYKKLLELALHLNEELAGEFLAMAIKEEVNAHRRLSQISLSSIYFDAAS